MSKQIGAARMRELADILSKEIKGLGFTLFVYEFGETDSPTNYISNSQREDMKKAVAEVLERWKKRDDFLTPEEN